jgi:hypothetical protein
MKLQWGTARSDGESSVVCIVREESRVLQWGLRPFGRRISVAQIGRAPHYGWLQWGSARSDGESGVRVIRTRDEEKVLQWGSAPSDGKAREGSTMT